MQTPRFCGFCSIAGTFDLAFCGSRPLRTSWLIVGIYTLLSKWECDGSGPYRGRKPQATGRTRRTPGHQARRVRKTKHDRKSRRTGSDRRYRIRAMGMPTNQDPGRNREPKNTPPGTNHRITLPPGFRKRPCPTRGKTIRNGTDPAEKPPEKHRKLASDNVQLYISPCDPKPQRMRALRRDRRSGQGKRGARSSLPAGFA
ncbi:hypothetical protein SPHV1_2230037 [Novosphingobium sp. KN65.2]|nr:hypothetical protein SPHV1_2230037 [Novosphingobium sp. KN65.2]